MVKVLIFPNRQVAKVHLANDMLATFCHELESADPRPVVLPTGTTYERSDSEPGVYQMLAERLIRAEIDISSLPIANMDAYLQQTADGKFDLLAPDDPMGYQYFMRTQLWDPLGLTPNNHIFPRPPQNGVPHQAGTLCKEYSAWLEYYGRAVKVYGGLGTPVVHLAFNGRGSSLDSAARIVELSDEERRTNASLYGRALEEISPFAATIGHSEIMLADAIVLAAFGKRKSAAIFRLLEEEGDDPDCPARQVLDEHPDVTLILDTEAASALPAGERYRFVS